jgi:tryptophan-rich sensory protein
MFDRFDWSGFWIIFFPIIRIGFSESDRQVYEEQRNKTAHTRTHLESYWLFWLGIAFGLLVGIGTFLWWQHRDQQTWYNEIMGLGFALMIVEKLWGASICGWNSYGTAVFLSIVTTILGVTLTVMTGIRHFWSSMILFLLYTIWSIYLIVLSIHFQRAGYTVVAKKHRATNFTN